MNYIIILFVVAIPFSLFGQDTTFYDMNRKITSYRDSVDYYTVILREQNDTDRAVVKFIGKSGQLDGVIHFSSYSKSIKVGEHLGYWRNGKLKRKDEYQKGKLIKGECYDSSGNQIPHFDFETMPQFPGGDNALLFFVQKRLMNFKNSEHAQGNIILTFVVNKDGAAENPKIKKGINKELDNQVLEILWNMPTWKPGMQDGVPVEVKYTLPINVK
jgi:hypothetical protein